MVAELWGVQDFWEKNNQMGITWKLRQWERQFFRATYRLHLIHIPIK